MRVPFGDDAPDVCQRYGIGQDRKAIGGDIPKAPPQRKRAINAGYAARPNRWSAPTLYSNLSRRNRTRL
jgi:hypothetical protein